MINLRGSIIPNGKQSVVFFPGAFLIKYNFSACFFKDNFFLGQFYMKIHIIAILNIKIYNKLLMLSRDARGAARRGARGRRRRGCGACGRAGVRRDARGRVPYNDDDNGDGRGNRTGGGAFGVRRGTAGRGGTRGRDAWGRRGMRARPLRRG